MRLSANSLASDFYPIQKKNTGYYFLVEFTGEGNIVDVISGEIFPGRIVHQDGVIRAVERLSGAFPGFLLPGFIDAHVHVDSSLLCPSRFAEAAVPHGTTAGTHLQEPFGVCPHAT